jgi:hypothetical protein
LNLVLALVHALDLNVVKEINVPVQDLIVKKKIALERIVLMNVQVKIVLVNSLMNVLDLVQDLNVVKEKIVPLKNVMVLIVLGLNVTQTNVRNFAQENNALSVVSVQEMAAHVWEIRVKDLVQDLIVNVKDLIVQQINQKLDILEFKVVKRDLDNNNKKNLMESF